VRRNGNEGRKEGADRWVVKPEHGDEDSNPLLGCDMVSETRRPRLESSSS
jgi:hypothetical protein